MAELELEKTYEVPTKIQHLIYSNPDILKDAYKRKCMEEMLK